MRNSLKANITEPFVIASNFAIQLVITVSLLNPSISGRVLIRWKRKLCGKSKLIQFVSRTIFSFQVKVSYEIILELSKGRENKM